MYILGISCFYHDSAACLLKDGKIIAAAQEERFTRKKHEDSFPKQSLKYCLDKAGITIEQVDHVGFYEKPFLKFERILEGYLKTWPKSYWAFVKAMLIWLRQKLWIKEIIKKELNYYGKIYFIEHHLAHAASSFLISPFEQAAILTTDAVGEWATSSYGIAQGNQIKIFKEIHWPDSLGMLYSAFTYYLGFRINSAEYKVMGAAPYGKPIYADLIKKELIKIKDDGSFKLNMKYFKYHYGLKMVNKKFEKLFNGPRRIPESKIEQRHWDIAASIQEVTNQIMVKLANYVYQQTKVKNICLAGGVALNCVSNSQILKQTPFENMFINPAAGDAGGAMGVAVYIDNVILNHGRRTKLETIYLGPEFSNQEIQTYLDKNKIKYTKLDENELIKTTAKLIADQKIIGWFQDKLEWGPRALGNRSIIADARNKANWQRVNLKIKFRESFRPFAPSVLEEKSQTYFKVPQNLLGDGTPTPYMLLVAEVNKKGIPAVTHVDNTARLQTVSEKQNPLYYKLIKEFAKLTDCPIIINTSFNVRGQPIVCTPHDAFLCFMRTEMDYLVMGNYLLNKKMMPPREKFITSTKQNKPGSLNASSGLVKTRIKKLVINLSLLFCSFIFIFLLAEVGTRILWQQSDNFWQSDDKIGMIHIPNKQGIYMSKEFANQIKINSHGFVGKEYAYQKEPGVFRAVVLGDSLTEAMEVLPEENYCGLLETALNNQQKGKYEIINLGIRSFGTGREYLTLKHYGLKYEPDLAILSFFIGNDVSNNFTEDENDPSFVTDEAQGIKKIIKNFLLDNSKFIRYVKEKGYQSIYLRKFFTKLGIFSQSKRVGQMADQAIGVPLDFLLYAKNYPETNFFTQAWEKTKYFIDKFKQITQENKIKLLVMILPPREQIYNELWQEIKKNYPATQEREWDLNKPNYILLNYLNENGIDYLDLYPVFKSNLDKSAELLYYKYDGHFSPTGHQVVSQALYKYITDANYFR